MNNLKLSAQKRTDEKASDLRANNQLPAIVYGRGIEPVSLSIDIREFEKVYKEVGESAIFTIEADGEAHDVLIRDLQRDAVSDEFIHADFYAIEKGQKIQVEIPLVFVGESPVDDLGGQVSRILHELMVECEPANLPQEIEVDISSLKEIGDTIQVGDLKLPTGVEALVEAEEAVAVASEVKEEAEEETTEAADIDFSEIEVEKKGSETETEAETTE